MARFRTMTIFAMTIALLGSGLTPTMAIPIATEDSELPIIVEEPEPIVHPNSPALVTTITLEATPLDNDFLNLSATVNAALEPARDQIQILKIETGEVLATCSTGTECIIETPNDGGSFVARTLKLESSVIDTNTESLVSTPTIVLATDKTEIDINGFTMLKATASDIPVSHNIYIFEADPTTLMNRCVYLAANAPTTCQVNDISLRNATTQTYIAYAASTLSPYSPASPDQLIDVYAVSNPVTVDLSSWYINLQTKSPYFESGSVFWLDSVSNQAETRSPYRTYIFDITSDTLIGQSSYETGSGMSTYKFDAKREYQAFVASNANGTPTSINSLVDVRAVSNKVTVRRQPWVTTINSSAGSNGLNVTLTANQKFFNEDYRGAIVDANTGRIMRLCSNSGTTCTLDGYPSPLYGDQNFPLAYQIKGVVGRWSEENGQSSMHNPIGFMTDIQSETGLVGLTPETTPLPSPGLLTSPHTNTGGSNPSQNCTQRCHADPVNSVTGEFWESQTDISAGGHGPGLNFVRSYSVSRSDQVSALGNGWTHNYEMRLESAQENPAPSSLDQASGLKVIQENGSLIVFTKTSTGSYVTDAATRATLERKTDGTYLFTRGKKQIFTFDSTGVIYSISDLNGNVNTVTHDGFGRVTQISDGHGRFLALGYDGQSRLTNVTDHAGRNITYEYDETDRLISLEDVRGETWSYGYNSIGLISTLTRPRGGVTTNEYDNQKRVISQTDPLGKKTLFGYIANQTTITYPDGAEKIEMFDNSGRVILETMAAGTAEAASTAYEYNDSNLPTIVTDGLGRTTSYTYDVNGNMLTETDAKGATTTWTYNSLNNPLTETNALGGVITFDYDAKGNLISTSSPTGRETRYSYNADGTVATIVEPRGTEDGADPVSFTTVYGYEPDGDLQSITSPMGNNTTFVTDPLGRVTQTTNAKGKFHSYVYDPAGILTESTDALNNQTSFSYDEEGNLVSEVDALLNETTYVYDLLGRNTSVTNAKQQTVSYVYDSMGRLTKTIDPNNDESVIVYDLVGRVKSETDAESRSVQYVWDKAGQVAQSVDPMNRQTNYAYDAAGAVVRITDPMSRITKYEYNALGQTVKHIDPGGRVSTYGYDDDGLCIEEKRNDNSVLGWTYDAAGNNVSTVDATQVASLLAYDFDGNATSSTDRLGRVTSYEYDVVGNLVKRIEPDASETQYSVDDLNRIVGLDYAGTTPDVSMSYDTLGRLISETVSSQETEYAYDAIGNMTRRGPPGTSGGVSYGYDNLNNLTTVTYPSERVVTYGYDKVGQSTSVQTAGLGSVSNVYNKNGLPTSVTLPSGVVETRTYNDSNEPLSFTATKGATNLYTKNHSYRSDGLIQSNSYTVSGSTIPTENVSYDALARIASFADQNSSFDTRGNRLTEGETTFGYDNAGQLLTAAEGSAGALTQYGYDGRGNRTSKTPTAGASTAYGYDHADRLTSVQTAITRAEYTYDAQGMRVTRNVNGQTSQSFVWDVNRAIPVVLDDSKYEFIYHANSYVPFAQVEKTTGTVTYLHADSIGSVVSATSDTGTLVGSYTYTLYGVSTQQRVSPFGFAGQYQDSVTGLYDFRNRVYDPQTGSFLQRDPAELLTDEPYAYTSGNPLQSVDPLGLFEYPGPINITDAAGAFTLTGAQKMSRAGGTIDAWTFGNAHRIENSIGVSGIFTQCEDQFAFGQVFGSIASPGIPGTGLAIRGISKLGGPKQLASFWRTHLANEAGHVVGPSLNKPPRWRVGDDVYLPGRGGNPASWNTVRARHWKNEAAEAMANPGQLTLAQMQRASTPNLISPTTPWSPQDIITMSKGRAPTRPEPRAPRGVERMELSHEPIPYRDGGTTYIMRWPPEHAMIDEYRRLGY